MLIRPVTIDDRDAHAQLYEAVAAEGRWIAAEVPLNDRNEILRRVDQAVSDPQVAMLTAEDDGRCVGFLGMQNRSGIVEFGMFRGGTTQFLCEAIERLGQRWPVVGFDSFNGFPPGR